VSNLIERTRKATGVTQAVLAKRLGVTPGAVSQCENAERRGSISLDTLRRTLEAMAHTLVLDAPFSGHQRRVDVDPELFAPLPSKGRGQPRNLLRAKHRIRTAAIAYDIVARRSDIQREDAWILADGISPKGIRAHQAAYAARVAAAYDKAVANGKNRRLIRAVTSPNGYDITPDRSTAHPVGRAITWAANMIANGVDDLAAMYAANSLILAEGFDWIMLQSQDHEVFQTAIWQAKDLLNTEPLARLLVARYDERD